MYFYVCEICQQDIETRSEIEATETCVCTECTLQTSIYSSDKLLQRRKMKLHVFTFDGKIALVFPEMVIEISVYEALRLGYELLSKAYGLKQIEDEKSEQQLLQSEGETK